MAKVLDDDLEVSEFERQVTFGLIPLGKVWTHFIVPAMG